MRDERATPQTGPQLTDGIVELRWHTPASLEPLLRWKNDPEIQRLSDDAPRTFTRDEVAATLRRWMRPDGVGGSVGDNIHDGALHFAIGLVGSGAPIGFLQLALVERAHRRCRLGLVVGEKELWGCGYGRRAVTLGVRHAFEVLGLERITAEVYADNPRSARLLQSAGFVREGVLRESIARDGQRVDELVFGVLRHEWVGQRTDQRTEPARDFGEPSPHLRSRDHRG